MELPVLDKFCFIFDLRTGCITMGIINSILTFVLAVILITFAVDIKDAAESKKDDMDSMSSVVYTIVVLIVVLLFVKFLLDLIFVWAVHKERSGIMKKYCIFWIVFLVLFIIGFLKTLFHMGAGHVIAQILFLGIAVGFGAQIENESLKYYYNSNSFQVEPLGSGEPTLGSLQVMYDKDGTE